MKEKLEGAHSEHWLGISVLHEPEYAFLERPKDELVYLTADTETTLDSLSKKKAYIIGGLVDRNRHKQVCAGRAEKLEVATGKLPVKENIKLISSPVLTVNHVFEIIMRA